MFRALLACTCSGFWFFLCSSVVATSNCTSAHLATWIKNLIVRCEVGVVKSCALNASAAADCSDILSHHFAALMWRISELFFFPPADILLINNKAIRQQTDVQIQLSRDIVQFNQIKLSVICSSARSECAENSCLPVV